MTNSLSKMMQNEAMFLKNDDLGKLSKEFIVKMKNEVKNSQFNSIADINLVMRWCI